MPVITISLKGMLISITGATSISGKITMDRSVKGRVGNVKYDGQLVVSIDYLDDNISTITPGPARDKITFNIG